MTTDRLETMAEAFKALAEQRFQVDRLVASELSGESFFTIKWKMISDLIDLGSRCQTPREAGNILEMLTEEIPGMVTYAEVEAGKAPEADIAPIVTLLEEMIETSRNALGDDVYKDMAVDYRRPPTSRPRR
jgi:hypothetical protein